MTARQTPLVKATPQQRRVLDAWRRHGSLKGAAHELGISMRTARNHVAGLYERTGARGAADVFFWLGVENDGMSKVPTELSHLT